jgi:hypothetical protein
MAVQSHEMWIQRSQKEFFVDYRKNGKRFDQAKRLSGNSRKVAGKMRKAVLTEYPSVTPKGCPPFHSC